MRLARALAGPEFYDCAACDRNPGLKPRLGHDGPPAALWLENLLTAEPLTRCPIRQLQLAPPELQAELDRDRRTLPLYQAGHLLIAGGISDQPARWLETMQEMAELEEQAQATYLKIKAEEPVAS